MRIKDEEKEASLLENDDENDEQSSFFFSFFLSSISFFGSLASFRKAKLVPTHKKQRKEWKV
jgi:hypothetical protein